uniref:Integrase catalytic domain-containing protein n=1 Tax=Strigamia maritima TaxID=126957 RepID=T1IH58_STRMM
MSKDESKSATAGIEKLDKINYEKWKMNIQFLMEEYQLWGFHDGTETQPPVGSCVADRLKLPLLKLPTCKEVWDHPAKLFEPTSIARNAKLYENFYLIQRNENEELETFINRIQKAADDLAAIKVTIDNGIKAYMLLNQAENVRRRFAEESQSKLDEVAAMYSGSKSRKNQKTPEENVPASGDTSETPTKESDDKSWLTCYNEELDTMLGTVPARVFKGVVHLVEASHVADDRDEAVASCLWPIQGCTRIENWYIDSGASDHICGQRSAFSTFEEVEPVELELGKGTSTITGRGQVVIRNEIDGKFSNLTQDNRANYHTHIYHGMMKVYFKNTRQCLMHAKREDNNLYCVLGEVTTENQVVWENPADSKPTGRRVENYTVSIDMWHKRFCHMYARGLNELAKNTQVKGLDLDSTVKDFSCEPCNLAKSTRVNYPKDNEKVSLGKASYLLCIVDDATRYAWVFPIPSKDAVFGVFKTFHARAERLSGFKLKAICTDRGGEFTAGEFEKYLRHHGIEIQRTNAYSPQMNGTAERINRTILDGVRAMLADTDLPQEFSVTLTCLKNRYPYARLKQEIPYVNWRKRHLSLRHLRRPSCVAYVNIPEQKQDGKLNVRAWKETNEVVETKQVKFREDQEWKDWSKASDESVSNDKFYDAKDLLDDLSLTPVKTPGPAAQRRDALPPVQPAAIHSPLQKLQKLKPPRPTRVAVRKPGRDGFDREEVTRTTGGSVGRVDVYYYGPNGKRLRSRKEVKDYCTANGLTYEILDFDFSSNQPVTSTLLDDPVDIVNLGQVKKLLGVEFERKGGNKFIHQR